MGGFLGALAGMGMLILIAALIFRFLRELSVLKQETARSLQRALGMTLAAGAVYWLGAALLARVLRGTLASAADLGQIFVGPYITRMFFMLEQPAWFAPASGLFAYAGHGLGAVLLGRYALGGVLLSFLMTAASVCLICRRLQCLWGLETAERLSFLLLCLPGAAFCFLPGWPPMALLLGAVVFSLAGKGKKAGTIALPPAVYDTALALCAVFSAWMLLAMIEGRIG